MNDEVTDEKLAAYYEALPDVAAEMVDRGYCVFRSGWEPVIEEACRRAGISVEALMEAFEREPPSVH